MAIGTITSKGQVTIPKEVRDRLGVKEGDRLVFRFNDRGVLELEAEEFSPVQRLAGILKQYAPAEPVSIDEMNAAIRARAVRKNRRATS
jgi:AbrB family looped-hinge helix DNA binding protein